MITSSFVCFTESQKKQAHQADIVSLLISQDETVKRFGKEWKGGVQKVTIGLLETEQRYCEKGGKSSFHSY